MKKYRVDTVFYHIGKLIWLPVVLAGSWFADSGYQQIGDMFACTVYEVMHLPCPGCGGTRAFYYFFHGNFWKSFCYHPAVLYGVVAYLHFMGLYFYRKYIRKNLEEKEISIAFYLYGAVAVILLQWIWKLCLIFKNAL